MICVPDLEFNEELHEYRKSGTPVPSVTQILQDVISFQWVEPEQLEYKRQLGIAVHLATQYIDQGTFDESSIAQEWQGYIQAYLKFKAEMRPRWDGIELRVYHPGFGYAGTLDRFGRIDERVALVDLKIGQPHPAHALQTSAYLEALRHSLDDQAQRSVAGSIDRWTLHLREDGTYRLRRMETAHSSDFAMFLSVMNIRRWRATHNV